MFLYFETFKEKNENFLRENISFNWLLKLLFSFNQKQLQISMCWASLVAQRVKHLPAIWETRVWSLGWEDPPEKEMATHSSILAWRIPWMEEPGRLQSVGSQGVRHDQETSLSFSRSCVSTRL